MSPLGVVHRKFNKSAHQYSSVVRLISLRFSTLTKIRNSSWAVGRSFLHASRTFVIFGSAYAALRLEDC